MTIIVTTLRSPVPGNYFGHYEQFFRQRLGEDGGQQGAGQGAEQELYRRWMSDTDISSGSECVEAASTRVNISHSQDIPDSDPADSGHGDSVFFSAKLAAGGSVESDQSGSVQEQELPLDLSVRSSLSSASDSTGSAGGSRLLLAGPGRRPPPLSQSSHSSHSYRSLSSESASKVGGGWVANLSSVPK